MSINKKNKKAKTGSVKKSFTSRQFRSGAYSSLITVLVIAFIVVINLVFHRLELTTDLSSGSLFTLSEETKNIAKEITEDITIYYMVQDGNEFEYIEKVIYQYEKLGKHIKVVEMDPVANPGFSEQYVEDGISDNDVIVVNEDTGAARYVSNGEMYYQTTDYYSSATLDYIDVEGRITSAIQYVLSEDNTKLYLVSGHGEIELSDTLTTAFEKMNIQVEELPLMTAKKIPEDCDVLIFNGPSNDLIKEEKDMVLEYLKDGGDAVILAQYALETKTPNLDQILKSYGLEIQKGVIQESLNHYVQKPFYIIPNIEPGIEMFTGVKDSEYILMANAQGIKKEKESALRNGITHTDLLTTSKKAYLKVNPASGVAQKEKEDIDGPFTVGVYVREALEEKETKMVVYSTAMTGDVLIQDAVGTMVETTGNSIAAKNLSYSTIFMGTGTQILLSLVIIILIPAGLLITGFGIWFVRRRK